MEKNELRNEGDGFRHRSFPVSGDVVLLAPFVRTTKAGWLLTEAIQSAMKSVPIALEMLGSFLTGHDIMFVGIGECLTQLLPPEHQYDSIAV